MDICISKAILKTAMNNHWWGPPKSGRIKVLNSKQHLLPLQNYYTAKRGYKVATEGLSMHEPCTSCMRLCFGSCSSILANFLTYIQVWLSSNGCTKSWLALVVIRTPVCTQELCSCRSPWFFNRFWSRITMDHIRLFCLKISPDVTVK